MRSRELDSMILMGPFQIEIFYGSRSPSLAVGAGTQHE